MWRTVCSAGLPCYPTITDIGPQPETRGCTVDLRLAVLGTAHPAAGGPRVYLSPRFPEESAEIRFR